MRHKQKFFSKTFFYFTEKHYLCALKMTITLFLTKIVTEYNNFLKQILK